ncbi:hypothetical protein Vadar_009922 [Vaccinium darrowii]|uniref:Uncharacterized protein n=1 Tax=Vaccinium darrowii TaxID=229202 RepID=A0ACB7XPI6_9ERIC|nr:hypothetical protein Vadar_009922 [Vaccinium darrowii]
MSLLRKLFLVEAINLVRKSTIILDVDFVHCGLVKGSKHGTGFINDNDGHVLTCFQLVADKVEYLRTEKYSEGWIPSLVTAKLDDVTLIFAKLVAVDASNNLALLNLLSTSVDHPVDLKPLSFALHLPKVGDALFCLGQHYGVPYALRYGFLSNPSL